jgi:hypothetical protein
MFHFSNRTYNKFRLVFLLLVLFAKICVCHGVTFQWDANNPEPDGYVLYKRAEGQPYDYSNGIDVGNITTYVLDDSLLESNVRYYFVVRAYVGSDTSGDSNEVDYIVTDIPTPKIVKILIASRHIEIVTGG